MPYQIPPIDELSQRNRSRLAAAIDGAVVGLWPNMFPILAKFHAVLSYEIHLRLAWLFKQLFASTADIEWLTRHGFELGITRVPAKVATGFATITVPVSSSVPFGLTFRRADGAMFRTRTSAIGAGALTTIELEALTAGTDGNSEPGTLYTLIDTGVVIGMEETATADASGLGGGADVEPVETLRQRILDRKRNPPQGGSRTDWERWVKESSGAITRVFVDSFINDSREVWISFLRSDRTNGIPTTPDVAAVQAYVEDDVRRPVTARVTVVAPTPVAVNIVITDIEPDSASVREAVEAELAAMFADRVAPATPTTSFKLYRAWISEAISRATGETSHVLTTPATDVTYSTAGQMPVLGTVTFA